MLLHCGNREEFHVQGGVSACVPHPGKMLPASSLQPREGRASGIKGGCQECYGLFQAYRACLTLREAIGAFETTVHSFITNKQVRGRCGDQRAFVPEAPLRLARRRSQEDGDAIAPEVLFEPGE
jgi:hypothetical protein